MFLLFWLPRTMAKAWHFKFLLLQLQWKGSDIRQCQFFALYKTHCAHDESLGFLCHQLLTNVKREAVRLMCTKERQACKTPLHMFWQALYNLACMSMSFRVKTMWGACMTTTSCLPLCFLAFKVVRYSWSSLSICPLPHPSTQRRACSQANQFLTEIVSYK